MMTFRHFRCGVILSMSMALPILAQVPTAPQPLPHTAEFASATVLKVIATEQDGYKFVAYLVKWNEAEVVIEDPTARSLYQAGDSIEFLVSKRMVAKRGVLSFTLMPKSGDSLEERNRQMKVLSGDLSVAQDESERFNALGAAARRAFRAGDLPEADKLARELAGLAPKYKQDWNYGNAIQNANQVLGLIALAANDVPEAKKRLLASADSQGSPQMNSFGPNMQLAKALLEKGEKEVVLEYFQRCQQFWKMGDDRLKSWRESVINGDLPDFGANLDY